MPYVITTSCSRCGGAGTYIGEMPAYEMRDGGVSTSGYVECNCAEPSSRAVATLEEARAALLADLGDMNAIGGPEDELVGDVLDMTESGGTIGPLPDGTVVEIESISWARIANAIAQPWPQADRPAVFDRLIDAYNAQLSR